MKISLPDITITLRSPIAEDGMAIWQLAKESGALDLNSPYAYMLLGEHFADTCVVAEHQGAIVGFVSAYIPPRTNKVLFIWQVGVAKEMRNQRLAFWMLMKLLQREPCQNISMIETTITPSNLPSRGLFNTLAQTLESEISEEENHFQGEWFPGGKHEPESLIRIHLIRKGLAE